MEHSQDNPALLTATGIGKRFGGREVLADVDLTLHAGRIVCVIGPNGAGKTTLIRILIGLMTPDTGTVSRRAGLRLGYTPQRLALDPILPLTVERFLRLGRASGVAIGAALQQLDIADLRRRQMHALSGGETQRVLLARALLREPQLLVLDEPAQGIDLLGQGDMYRRIAEVAAERDCGIIMISHDLHLVMSAADEVICLNQHICCRGQPEQVSSDPAYLSLFGSAASSSVAVYTHRHSHAHDLAGAVIAAGGAENGGNQGGRQ